MHLSVSCSTPGRVGEYRGFDKLNRQMPHPWGQVGCQIPTMSPGPSSGLDSTFMLSISLLLYQTVVSAILCLSKQLLQNFEKLQPQCQLPQGWRQVLMSNPHLWCGDARGWGMGLEIDKCITWHSKHTSKWDLSEIERISSGNLNMLIANWYLLLFIHYSTLKALV